MSLPPQTVMMQTSPISELIRMVAAANSPVPRHPQQAASGKNVDLDIRKGVQLGAVAACSQQGGYLAPRLRKPFGIDATSSAKDGV